MSQPLLVGLAVLKVNWERLGFDYTDSFLAFVLDVLASQPDEVVSLPALSAAVHSEYGLQLPLNTLKTLLSRAAKQGFLHKQDGTFSIDRAKCATRSLSAVRNATIQAHSRLVTALTAFAHTSGHEWSTEQAETALLSFLAEHSLATLFAKVEGTVLQHPSGAPEDSYIMAAFAATVQTSDPALFNDLLGICKGNLLANALYLPEASPIQQNFKGTTVFLDTSVLVFAAGFAGADRQAPMAELVTLLKKHGASLGCFRETIEEIRGILDASAHRIRTKDLRYAFGPTIEHFVAAGTPSSDIDLLSARCEQHVAALGVTITDRPSFTNAYSIDETAFERILRKQIGYKSDRALVHDLDCIAAIIRLRRGREANSIENSKAVFVTTNTELARTAKQFFQPDVPPGTVAPCITSHVLANLLWLKNPTIAPDLPRSLLIADAYAALQPSEELWKAYLAEIARLQEKGNITPDQYYLLRYSHSAKRALMDITKGEPSAFSEGTPLEVLALARENLRSDLTQELGSTKEQLSFSTTQLSDAQRREERREAHLTSLSERSASWVLRISFWIVLILLGVATLYTFPWSLPPVKDGLLSYLLSLSTVGLFVISVISLGWGTDLRGILGKAHPPLSRWIDRRLRSVLQPPPQ